MAKNVVSSDSIKINGILNIEEDGMITVSIEDIGDLPLAELIGRFNDKDVSISVGWKEEIY